MASYIFYKYLRLREDSLEAECEGNWKGEASLDSNCGVQIATSAH